MFTSVVAGFTIIREMEGKGKQNRCTTTKAADPFDGSLLTGHPMRVSKSVWCHYRNKIGTCSSCLENNSSIPVKFFFSTGIFQYGFKINFSLTSTCIASGKVHLQWPGKHSGMPSGSPCPHLTWHESKSPCATGI